MEHAATLTEPPASDGLVRTAHASAGESNAAQALAERLGPGPFALIAIFASPQADIATVGKALTRLYPEACVTGCTTAGEISEDGYTEGEIVAVALPSAHFCAETLLVPDLGDIDSGELIGWMIRTRQRLTLSFPDFEHEFAFLLVDGLSIKEDELTSALASGLGPVPLFGGSAGDGTRFRETFVLSGERVLQNAATLTFVRTDCPVRVFNLDHLVPTDRKMVVTEADPKNRVVRRINAEPAAHEYARMVGKDPAQLSTFTFAANPMVVKIGGKHHARAIQQIAENGDLVFYSAIDEGLVLTLAEPQDLASHLASALADLSEPVAPEAILACDCILRRIEAEQKQSAGRISDLFRKHRVTGFSTYGEQLNSMHVNQTMTGVAFYPPGKRRAGVSGGS